MDLDLIDPRSMDVGHQVSKLSFRFYSDQDAEKLSVRRLTSPSSFDEIGRPLPRGLYDPVLGPTSYEDGDCPTCNQSYATCPGHFGHIQLPIPVPNPLLLKLILKILRASCWHCQSLRQTKANCNLLLACLYFEDANMPKCAAAIDAFRLLRRTNPEKKRKKSEEVEDDSGDEFVSAGSLVKNWKRFLKSMPQPIPQYLSQTDVKQAEQIESQLLDAARETWHKAKEAGTLARSRSQGWKDAESLIMAPTGTKCPHCSRGVPKTRKGERGRFFRSLSSGPEVLLSPTQIEAQIAALWENHTEVFDLLYGLKGREIPEESFPIGHYRLFVRIVLVPPPRFRPMAKAGLMEMAAEHPQNIFFQRILTEIDVILSASQEDDGDHSEHSDTPKEPKVAPSKARLALAVNNMQDALQNLYDSSNTMSSSQSGPQMTGIRQQLEAKAGLFRQHMMGKRVNYSCRSVIGPDVFLDTNEIGIPESFAKQLTVPELVTPMNLERMQRAVLNGPDKYPGAVAVEDWGPGGNHRLIKFRNSAQKNLLNSQARLLLQNRVHTKMGGKTKQANGHADSEEFSADNFGDNVETVPKRVHRHLRTGDIVLFNRQPTLHRVSIMAHKVRVLPGDRTIRFHYANCGSYNADFDGDEMNVHVPQDYVSRAEAEELMLSSKHYIVPTSGAPVRGLIQDHIASATLLSTRDTFLSRESFTQLLYVATERLMVRPGRASSKYTLPPPAIIKPRPLWSGKQLISTVLAIIANGRPGLHLTASSKTKSNTIGEEETQILFRDGKLLRGIIDKSSLGSTMYGIVHAVQEAYGPDSSDDFLSSMSRLCLFYLRTHGHTTGVDDLLLTAEGDRKRDKILKDVNAIGISVTNSVYAEMSKGDKGSTASAQDPSSARILVEKMIRRDGIEAEDRLDTAMKSALNKISSDVMKACVPESLQKIFPNNGFALMTSTGAKGSAVNSAQISCLLGSTVLEGKRVPRMGGSGATLPCFKPYDPSPVAGGFIASRFLTGITPHEFFFHAMSGREGLLDTSLKTANSGYLQRCLIKHMEGVRLHYDYTVRDSDDSVVQFIYGDDGIDPSKSRWLNEKVDWQIMNQDSLKPIQAPPDKEVSKIRKSQKIQNGGIGSNTMLEMLSPGALSRRGAVSELYRETISDATKKHPGESKSGLRHFLEGRYQSCALEPGEAVGILAAQGVGEPSTQMTLNTFHHAGSSSAHVTLGIPRLRELLMTASKYPKTPSMTLPIVDSAKKGGAQELCTRLQNIHLLDLMLSIEIEEEGVSCTDIAIRTVKVSLHLPPEKLYAKQVKFDFNFIREVVERKFLYDFHMRLMRELIKVSKDNYSNEQSIVRQYTAEATKIPKNKPEFDSEEKEEVVPFKGLEDEEVSEASQDDHGSSSDEDSDSDDSENFNDDGEMKTGLDEELANTQDSDIIADLLNGPEKLETKAVAEQETLKKRKRKSRKRLFLGSLGYCTGSLVGKNKRRIEFNWSLPVALVGKLDIASVVKESAANTKLAYVERISRCFIDKGAGGRTSVITEGSNVHDIIDKGEGLIDMNRLETNDMFGILNFYGVEAMRAALIQEFVKVFEAYGIPVNIRHLRLIADYMTVDGSYRGFNRRSMNQVPSPFQKITFETSMNFLTDATLNSTDDMMKNPSTVVALGQLYEGGTGGFQLQQEVV